MVLLEIAAQGVRGFAPAGGRLALRPGYNVVSADGPALRRLLEALWYPDAPADAVPRSGSGPGAPVVRAGLTVVGNDGVTVRVLRDLAAGSQLQRFDPERRAFLPVAQDAGQIAAALRQGTGVPSQARLAALLVLSAADLPSRQSPAMLSPAASVPRKALAPEEAQRRVAALRDELLKARAAEKLQYQLDGLQSRLFKLEEILKSGEQVRERLRAAEESLAALRAAEGALQALGDAPARIAAFEKAAARRDETLAKIAAEREGLGDADVPAFPPPFWTERGFLLGLGGAAAALAVGLATEWSAVALAAIPAAGYAGFLGLRWVGEAETRERAARRVRVLEDRERKTREAYEREGADVRAAMKALRVDSLSDLREILARLEQSRAGAVEERERLAEWEARPESREASAERAAIQEQVGEIEARLTEEAGGYVRDPRSIEGEIQRIEADLESPPEAPAPAAPAAPAGDPLKSLLERAAAELSGTTGAALRAIQPRVLQLLPAVSAQRFSALLVDERGNLLVQGGGKTLPVATLAAADRDLCFVALKLGFLEQALAAGKSVAVVEDALGGLPEPVRRTVARLLKQLGRAGQIVHATADPLFREAADHAA